MNTGLIVEAESPLVQFEIQRYADGVVDEHLPHVVWVDSAAPLRSNGIGIGCHCTGPFYAIRDDNGAGIACPFPGHTPSVCLCMGRFIE